MTPLALRGARRMCRATAVLAAFALCGCMERALLVRSDPPGARIWVNGVDRGTTPVRLRYVRDGRFSVRLEKKGYETVADEVVTRTAIDAVPGVDFFYENGPGRHVRETTADFRLVPLVARAVTDADLEAVRRRGDAFRREGEAAAAEPGTPQPTRPHGTTPPAAPPAGRSR